MSSLSAYAVIAFSILFFSAVAYATWVVARRIVHDDGRLRLEPMMDRHGASLRASVEDGSYQAALATRRCVTCADKARCDAWLASGRSEGAEEFCPNAAFVKAAGNR